MLVMGISTRDRMDEGLLMVVETRGGREGRKDRCMWLPEDVKIMIHRAYYVLVRVIRDSLGPCWDSV